MRKTYSEKLKDPRWQKKRLLILQRDDFSCQCCKSKTETLHVHHKLYVYGREPWEYDDDYLITLCHDCHGNEEVLKSNQANLIFAFLRNGFLNTELVPLDTLLYEAIKRMGKNQFDLLITRIALSDHILKGVIDLLKNEPMPDKSNEEPDLLTF